MSDPADGGSRREPAPDARDTSPPALVACSHGTRSPAGRRVVAQLRLQMAQYRPGVRVRPAYVDVQRPGLAEVVDDLAGRGQTCVVVPLLLSCGTHTERDIARVIARHPGTAVATPPLGPDPLLAEVLAERLQEAGHSVDDAVVLVAAGSSDTRGRVDVADAAALLTERLGVSVAVAALAGSGPALPAVLAEARRHADRVTLAGYLLAPGHFSERLRRAGADRVTGPLAPHPLLARLALARYDAALDALASGRPGRRTSD